jgi:hypothetical protein
MRSRLFVIAIGLGILGTQVALTQAPAGAPTGATGKCNDGSYATTATKKGACRGHQGVKTWFATSSAPAASSTPAAAPVAAPAPTPAATPTPAPVPAQASAPKTSSHATGTPAPGGGPGLVWLNTSTNVYHCSGTRYYGTTKAGKYVTEADAKAAGAHADHG